MSIPCLVFAVKYNNKQVIKKGNFFFFTYKCVKNYF